MSKFIGRIRRSSKSVGTVLRRPLTHPTRTSQGLDQKLSRVANVSQFGLLLLAVFGYFYTVLPIYQKSLLDEEIAKKTIELRTMEIRVSETQGLLQSREQTLASMNKKLSDQRSAADAARRGMGAAQAEAGALRGKVDSQYLELLPRLLGDFRSLALAACKTSGTSESGFADCVERKVLSSPVLTGLGGSEKTKLTQLVRQQSPKIHKSWVSVIGGIEARKLETERNKASTQQNCDQLKGTDDYKDKLKKISIDYQCNVDLIRVTSESQLIQIDEIFLSDKVIAPELAVVVREFFRK